MGLLRLLLALSVIAGHAQASILGMTWVGAWYAVNAFFIISGFYMALVLNEKYKTNEDNKTFYINRILRLYPVYLIGLLASAVVNIFRGSDFSGGIFGKLGIAGKIYYILSNSFIVGQDLPYLLCLPTKSGACSSPLISLNPPAWSIAVEVLFYAMAPMIVRSLSRTLVFVFLGALYLAIAHQLSDPIHNTAVGFLRAAITREQTQYYFFPASFMFFGLGALAYHVSRGVPWEGLRSAPAYLTGLGLIGMIALTNGYMPWFHALIFAAAIPFVFQITKRSQIDRAIGDLSYPVYIFHFPLLLGLRHTGYSGEALANATALASVVCGILAWALVDRPIERYRHNKTTQPLTSG